MRSIPSTAAATEQGDNLQSRRFPSIMRTLITVGIVIALVAGYMIIVSLTSKPGQASGSNKTVKAPEYATVAPAGKSIQDLGGWKRVSPPENDPVFAYEDSVDTVGISVSQQPLPKSFTGKVDSQVAELAKKFNATDKVDADGTAVYIGTSAKGPQSVILTKSNLLILIKSQKQISDASWIAYVKSLKTLNADDLPKY